MTSPKIGKEISIGNIVSWIIMAAGLIVAFTKLEASAQQSALDSSQAKAMAYDAQDRLNLSERIRDAEASQMKLDIAVIKVNVLTIKENVDDIKKYQKSNLITNADN